MVKTLSQMTNNVCSWIGLKTSADEHDAKIFNSGHAISAKSAYMRSKYGRSLSQKDLLQKFFSSVNNKVQAKSSMGEYCCMVEIDDDIREFLPEICKHFQDKLGYKMAIIDRNTEIVNGTHKIVLSPNSAFMILMWNTPDISEDVFQTMKSRLGSNEQYQPKDSDIITDDYVVSHSS